MPVMLEHTLITSTKTWDQDYQPVQDLRRVNKRVETVPDPYTQLSMLLPEHKVYTVLDLKDAFFSIPFP